MKPEQNVLDEFTRVFVEIPFNRTLGLELTDYSANDVSIRFNMKQELIGNFIQGILHGGVISSVLDMAGGMNVMLHGIYQHPDATLESLASIVGKCSTIDLQISYLRPGKGETFTAKSFLVKSGNKIAFTRMELYNQDNVLIATGNGTYAV